MGNLLICSAKLGAWISSGSSAMMAEFIHSVVDCGNQALLVVGLRESQLVADRRHPYGYGKSIYFWALVSALGTFFLGAGVRYV
jgi:zinc transporter 9